MGARDEDAPCWSRHHERPGTLGAPQKHPASIHWQVRAGPGVGQAGGEASGEGAGS